MDGLGLQHDKHGNEHGDCKDQGDFGEIVVPPVAVNQGHDGDAQQDAREGDDPEDAHFDGAVATGMFALGALGVFAFTVCWLSVFAFGGLGRGV